MKNLRTIILLTSLIFLLAGVRFGSAQTVPDFTQPYGPVQRAIGTHPLLVILLGTSDPAWQPTRSQQDIRNLIFGSSNSVAAYYLETSYGQFTFTEAFTTPWLTAQGDPSTGDWDESTSAFLYAGGYDIERRKSAYVIQQLEQQTQFRFSQWDTNGDGVKAPKFVPIKSGKSGWVFSRSKGVRRCAAAFRASQAARTTT